MLTSVHNLFCFAILLTSINSGLTFAEEPLKPKTPPILESDGVRVDAIHINRTWKSNAPSEVNLSSMEILLWLGMNDTAPQFLVQLVNLEPIIDDTGKVLSTDQRRKEIYVLGRNVVSGTTRWIDSRNGPVVSLTVDAPARKASHIQSFKGRIEVTPISNGSITLKNLPSLIGKQLQHKFLKDLDIVPNIEKDNQVTKVTLKITGQHERLRSWKVQQNGRPLILLSTGSEWTGEKSKRESQTYPTIPPKMSMDHPYRQMLKYSKRQWFHPYRELLKPYQKMFHPFVKAFIVYQKMVQSRVKKLPPEFKRLQPYKKKFQPNKKTSLVLEVALNLGKKQTFDFEFHNLNLP